MSSRHLVVSIQNSATNFENAERYGTTTTFTPFNRNGHFNAAKLQFAIDQNIDFFGSEFDLSLLNCVPYVPTCQFALRAYVLTCQLALRAYVLTCSRANVPYVLFVPTYLHLRAHVL